MVNRYKTKLDINDFSQSNSNVDNNDFRPIMKFKIPPKQVIAPGAGVVANGVDLRDTLKADIQDSTGATIAGKFRWVIKDANEANSLFGNEYKTSDVKAGVKEGVRPDRAITEDAYIVLLFRSDSASATIDFTKSSVEFPVTIELINNLPQ